MPRRADDDTARPPADMVKASPSLWDGAPPTPARRVVAPARRPASGPRRPPTPAPRRRWPWLVGGAAIVATGVAAAIVLGGGGDAARPDELAARTPPTRVVPAPDATSGPADVGAAHDQPVTRRAPAPAPEPPVRPAWVDAVVATNPWVVVAGGKETDVLGVSAALASGAQADRLTGFRPADGVRAPARPYRLQQHEITWAELELAAAHLPGIALLERPTWVPTEPARRARLPATGVPWSLAREFCRAMGGELPSEAQWEWAARGPEKRPFPWGDAALDQKDIRITLRKPVPVADVMSSPLDRTPGPTPIHDLLGNALEWTADLWTDGAAATHQRAVRGWPLAKRGERVPAEGSTYRQGQCVTRDCDPTANDPYTPSSLVGFRCAAPVER